MRKALLFMALFFVNTLSFSQNYNWITPNKTYLKLYVAQDGIYRINKTDFTNAGISTTTMDPRTVKVTYKGVQVPVYFEGEGDGVFNDNDFFDFWGVRNYGGQTSYLKGLTNELNYVKNEYYDYYSDTSVYWIDWGGANGLRMANISSSFSFPNYGSEYFIDNVHCEENMMYSDGENRNSQNDYRHFNPELIEGEGWYWSNLFNLYTTRDSVAVKNLYKSAAPLCGIKFFAYPNADDTNRIRIGLDNYVVGIYKTIGYNRYDTTVYFPPTYIDTTVATSKFRFTFLDSTNGSPGNPPYGNVYFDYFDFFYPSKFKFYKNNLSADLVTTSPANDTTTKRFSINGYNSANGLTLYDVRNGIRITNYTIAGDSVRFSAKSNAILQVNNSNVYKKPLRIKQKQVANLVSNAADYIVVYNSLFESSAEMLRSHRQTNDSMRAVKANIEDIYDIFNYGMENPKALRLFVKNAYDTWQSPKVKYLCLFGRGSLDPKKYQPNSVFYQNLVPTYGNPTSDGYFGSTNLSSYVYVPQVMVGRLPAYNAQEASDMVIKLIDYDNQRNNYSSWWKKGVFITGGLNRTEQLGFKNESDILINSYFANNPLKMNSDRIYRNDSAGGISFQFSDSIIHMFNNGAMFINYQGHAGNGTWDNGLENPDLLSNGTKLPFIFSMTCFTGKNAISERREFGEKFLYLPNKGAIGFVGNSGWTFQSNGQSLNKRFSDGFKSGLRRLGEVMRYALVADSNGATSATSARFTLGTYSLLGDPASKILMPNHPEFEILPGNFTLSNPFPAVNESVLMKLFPADYGVGADSVKFRFQFFRNGIAQGIKDTVVKNFGRLSDTLGYRFVITSGGNYSLKFTIDPDNWFPLDRKTNNSINVNIPIRNISYVPLKPVDNSFITTDSIEFSGLNPNIDAIKNSVKILLQIDTVSSFSNPRTFFKTVTGGISSSFRTTLPVADTNLVYYWRMNSIINNDSSGWSTVQRLIYNPSGTLDASNAVDSVVKISKKRLGQFDAGTYQNLEFGANGFTLPFINGTLRVKSHGREGGNASEFVFNGGLIRIDNFANSGICIMVVNKLTGRFLSFKNFPINNAASSDSIVNYLNTIDSNKYVLIGKVDQFNGDTLRTNAKNKIKEFGARMVDSVRGRGQYAFETWAFIGSKGASPENTSEQYFPNNVDNGCPNNWCPSNAELTRNFQASNGTLTQTFGPARSWKSFTSFATIPSFSSIKYNVFGKNTQDQTVLLYSNVNSSFTFDTLNALTYPYVTIVSAFNLDSLSGTTPPSLKSFVMNYIPPIELAVDNYSFTRSDTTMQEGDSVTIGVNYSNIGYSSITSFVNTWYTFVNSQKKILKLDTISNPLAVNEIRTSQVNFSTQGFGYQGDSINIYFDSYPAYPVNEFSSYNNTGVTQIIVKADSIKPIATITFDGTSLTNGDYIRSNPEIVIQFFDDSPIAIQGADTNTVKIKLNQRYVPYANNPDIQFIAARGYKLGATVKYYPKLTEGDHKIEFDFIDKTGNIGDTIKHNFLVSYDMKLLSLNNYPNPFKDKTTFNFTITGAKRPDTAKIRIYSVSGRLVKEIQIPNLIVGYNQVEWDGKDNDGDAMANGVYFYKMIMTGDTKIETKIEKIAILK